MYPCHIGAQHTAPNIWCCAVSEVDPMQWDMSSARSEPMQRYTAMKVCVGRRFERWYPAVGRSPKKTFTTLQQRPRGRRPPLCYTNRWGPNLISRKKKIPHLPCISCLFTPTSHEHIRVRALRAYARMHNTHDNTSDTEQRRCVRGLKGFKPHSVEKMDNVRLAQWLRPTRKHTASSARQCTPLNRGTEVRIKVSVQKWLLSAPYTRLKNQIQTLCTENISSEISGGQLFRPNIFKRGFRMGPH